MPTPTLQSYAEKSGKPIQSIEKYWADAKTQARKKFIRKDSGFWAYVNAIVKKRAGIREGKTSFKTFISPIE